MIDISETEPTLDNQQDTKTANEAPKSKRPPAEKTKHHGTGHRGRLRKRLLDSNGQDLSDHELIEYLLTLAIPRRETKTIAKELLDNFGGLSGLMTADAEAIARQPYMGETSVAAIKIVKATATRLLSEPVRTLPILASWQSLLDYLRADMAHLTIERVRILYLNSKNMLIRDEIMSEGSLDSASIYTREVIRRSIDIGAAAIIMVHNHPSGDSAPSKQDIKMTHDIIEASRHIGVTVHDHVIIGKDGHSSMRSAGLL